jgi:deazaflavin-dependent oxidoreductase (nitroreductase family)
MTVKEDYAPSPSGWVRDQVEKYEASDGREANTVRGMPIVVVTSRGARSGKLRKNPVMRVERDREYAVIASKGGAPRNPQWVYNLLADSRVWLQDGPERHEYVARLVDGEERATWWDRAVEAFPDYASYQKKTTREIPVFVLTRA